MENNKINRKQVLEILVKHETLTIEGLAKKENLGVASDTTHLVFLLEELKDSGHIQNLGDVTPLTYTITKKGIDEAIRLRNGDSTLRAV